MAFFDLNIPIEQEAKDKNKAKSAKNTRVKLVVKAMELGYSGIAYNRFVSGIMADTDRCTIAPLPLSSLLEASPGLAETVKFHREVLGLPVDEREKMRQYSRVTVGVECMLQAAALNPNNQVLLTYDLVAVHPMNPNMFEHACLNLEVDLISIDLSRKLPFRLKSSLIRAAVQRGVFFEVMYSSAISNLHARREIFKQVQVLVEWTHGRNIIVSSASPSVNELRGPIDVVNMSTLFGLSTEHAKAAISKNCRSLILHGLARKNCYKMAIQVKNHPPDGIVGSDKAWFNASEVWDPISSGEGDVVLKTNLVTRVQLNNKKCPASNAKKRHRRSGKSVCISSSHNSTGLLHQNTGLAVDPGTSICGLRLEESKLDLETKMMENPNTNRTVLDFDTFIIEQNPGVEKIRLPQAMIDGNYKFSFPSAMEFLPLDVNAHQVMANGIRGTLLQTDEMRVDGIAQVTEHESSTNKNVQPFIVFRDGNDKFSFSSATEFLPIDDDSNQVMANGIGGTLIQTAGAPVEGITDVTESKSGTNKIMQSCIADIGPGNHTDITPSSSFFTVDEGRSVIGVHKDALEVCKGSSLLSDDSRDLIFIRRDSICDNVLQMEVSELKPHGRTIGVEVEKTDTVVLGSDIEMNGLKTRENEKHITEPNIDKGILVSYGSLTDTPMPTMGVEEGSAACLNDDAHTELIPKIGREGKLRRQNLDSIPSLSLRGILKSGSFKKKVQSRKGTLSKRTTRKKR